MIYELRKKLSELVAPKGGRWVAWEPSDRASSDVSRGLTPEDVDSIMTAANSGDIERQSRLAAEIDEKNWDIAQALQTRRLAVAGTEWEVLPAQGMEKDAKAQAIAAEFEAVLRSPRASWGDQFDTFEQAVTFELMGALLPGFSVVEIIWADGGKRFDGFAGIEQRHFTFNQSTRPLLVTTANPQGVELPFGKFVYHRHRARSGDATRGGLVRPLAWMHCFQNLAGVKDLLAFIERHGMPFVVGKLDQDAWEKDRNRIKHVIENFGSSGGGVFTKAVELELLQASSTTGDIFFRLLEYFGDAIEKVVLGQTATSGPAGGLSKGDAQAAVREDIRVGDCKAIDATLNSQLARPWTAWNHGPDAPAPRVHHLVEEAEDLKLASEILVNLNTAGLEVDEAEASERFGWKLTRKAPPPPPPAIATNVGKGGLPSPTPSPDGDSSENDAADAASLSDKSPTGMGVGRGDAPSHIDSSVADTAGKALNELLAGRGLADWFGPLSVAIEVALRGEPSEAEFRTRLDALVKDLPEIWGRMSSREFEETLARAMYGQAAEAMAQGASKLKGGTKPHA